jgi:hypothetical protein
VKNENNLLYSLNSRILNLLQALKVSYFNLELKCLHLKEGSNENEESLFKSGINIKIPDINLLEELFKIQDRYNSSSDKLTKSANFIEKKFNSVSTLLDTNRMTGIGNFLIKFQWSP